MSKTTKKRMSTTELAKTIALMETMTLNQLQLRYAEVFGETTGARSKTALKKKITKRLREIAAGTAPKKAAKKAPAKKKAAKKVPAKKKTAKKAPAKKKAAKKAPAKKTTKKEQGRANGKQAKAAKAATAKPKGRSRATRDARLPAAGTVLSREYRGTTYEAKVLEEGFEYNGELYGSLSKIASEIAGTSWNGFLFFKLGKQGS